jgi:hypothetical protein
MRHWGWRRRQLLEQGRWWRQRLDGDAAWWSSTFLPSRVPGPGRQTGWRRLDPGGGERSPRGKAADRVRWIRDFGLPNDRDI